MTANEFRKMALALDDAEEGEHMGHPDFRVGGRIFSTLLHDMKHGNVSLTPEQQARFLKEAPDTFTPAAGAWGRGGATTVRLETADEELVGEALTLAWKYRVAKNKPTRKRR